MGNGSTIFPAPANDHAKARIENILELTPVIDIGPDVYTNTRPLWHPPGARGIYGGAAIAQCLAAAQKTVPSNFLPHSMHCYFVLSGDSSIPILYHVERVRDGKSFATRTVQARQRGRPIFTTTISFDREGSGGEKKAEHTMSMPQVPLPPDNGESGGSGPFESRRADIVNSECFNIIFELIKLLRKEGISVDKFTRVEDSSRPEEKLVRQYLRARDSISAEGGHEAHLSALAYMSDSYFIGTVARVQDIPRFSSPAALNKTLKSLKNPSDLDDEGLKKYYKDLAENEAREIQSSGAAKSPQKEIGMMVSLDHTIYFHNRRGFRADEWIFTENMSPWAGEGRGLVTQKMWTQDGSLIATCIQEGVVRLKQDKPPSDSKL